MTDVRWTAEDDRFAFREGDWVTPRPELAASLREASRMLIGTRPALHRDDASSLYPFETAVLRGESDFVRSASPMKVVTRLLRGRQPWYQVGALYWPETALKRADPSTIPSDDPAHVCGMYCDGQDGMNSLCAQTRRGEIQVTRVPPPVTSLVPPPVPVVVERAVTPAKTPQDPAPLLSVPVRPERSVFVAWMERFQNLEVD